MAQAVKLVQGTLPSDATAHDITSSGFGTPTAAIVFTGDAFSGDTNTQGCRMSIGYYDGSSQYSVGYDDKDGEATTVATRSQSNSEVLTFPTVSSGPDTLATYTASFITDGIRLTIADDNTGSERFVVIILLKGVTAKVGHIEPTSSLNGTKESASLGFAPEMVMMSSIGYASATKYEATVGIWSLGVAKKNGTQHLTTWGSAHFVSTSRLCQYYATDRVVGQVFNDVVSWTGEITTWGSDTFTLTTRDSSSTGGDYAYYIAFDSDISVDIGEISTPTTTGNQTITTTGIDPEVVFLAGNGAEADGTVETGDPEGVSLGASDGTNSYCFAMSAEDDVGTTATNTEWNTDRAIDINGLGAGTVFHRAHSDLTVGTEEFVLDWPDVHTTSKKGFYIAFGGATGGSTYTATAAMTTGGSEASASATFTEPTYTATSDLTAGGVEPSVSATFTAPVFTASSSITNAGAEFASSATFATQTYTASVDLTTGTVESASVAAFAAPVFSADVSLTMGGAESVAAASFEIPSATAAASIEIGALAISAAGTYTAGVFTTTEFILVGTSSISVPSASGAIACPEATGSILC